MTDVRRPNFFIVGAGKSGTTALYAYLRAHPRVFVSSIKEPRFFADDMPGLMNRVASRDEYLALFGAATHDHLAVGEASPQYLYSRTAIRNIHEFDSGARLIVMLRSPIDIAHAAHMECLYWGVEYECDFERAWRLQHLRKKGRRIPRSCTQPTVLLWEDMARLGEQVARLLETFPREQVHFIAFDEFVADTAASYREALSFLGVPDDGRRAFPPVNESKRNRFELLGRSLLNPPGVFAPLRRLALRTPVVSHAWNALVRLNTAPARRAPLRPAFARELADVFREDVKLLSRLVGRDFTHWLDR